MKSRPLLTVAVLLWSVRIATAVCGDGIVELGELCDAGADPSGTCCTQLCTFALPGTLCRDVSGECDLPEVCTGASGVCPANVFKPAGICRPAAGPCDLAESCSGVGPACPGDSFAPSDLVCRPAIAPCDLPETCSGSSIDCPPDTGEPDDDQDGVCDALDNCPAMADSTQADGDGDGLGDVCDPCTNVAGGKLENPRLALAKLSAPAGDDRLRLKATLSIPTTPPIDPLHNGLRLVLFGPLGPVADAIVPPGSFDGETRAGWRTNGDGRWSYRNGGDSVPKPAGITKILLRQDRAFASLLRIVVSGRAGDFRAAVGQSALVVAVVIDVPTATTGQCGEAEFVTVGAESDCRLLNGGRRLECRIKE